MSHHGRKIVETFDKVEPALVLPETTSGAGQTVDPHVPEIMRSEANRPVKAGGGGKHRGDRRDMSKTYTTNTKHSARGNTARKDVSTRKR